MKFSSTFSLLIAVIIPSLIACSSSESLKQAELDFDYLEIEKTVDLLLPEGVESSAYNHEYTIPDLGDSAPKAYVGQKVDIRSPSLVLPITAGSRVEQRQDMVILWIDIPEGMPAMEEMLWSVIKGYIASKNIEVESFSKELGELDTQWYVISNDDENIAVYNLKQRYQYKVIVKPHGRTLGISAKLLGHQKQVTKNGAWHDEISALDSQRYSVQALNKLILFFDANREEYQTKVAGAKPNTLLTKEYDIDGLGVDLKLEKKETALVSSDPIAPHIAVTSDFTGNAPLIILEAPFSSIGPALKSSLMIMGFEVGTVIAIDGYVSLNYLPPAPLTLSAFDVKPLALDAGSYQLMVGDLSNKSSLLFSDGDGRVLERWQVEQLLTHLIPLMANGVYPKRILE